MNYEDRIEKLQNAFGVKHENVPPYKLTPVERGIPGLVQEFSEIRKVRRLSPDEKREDMEVWSKYLNTMRKINTYWMRNLKGKEFMKMNANVRQQVLEAQKARVNELRKPIPKEVSK